MTTLIPISHPSDLPHGGAVLVVPLEPDTWRMVQGRDVYVCPSPILENVYYMFMFMEAL